jgi:predicted nucleotidyltransferase
MYDVSLNNYLKTLSYQYYLKNNHLQTLNINRSVDSIIKKIDQYFEEELIEAFVFGSYDRDTILPRIIDPNSDVDIMVVFNHSDFRRTPETYRNWLKQFAEESIKKAEIYKDSPTIVIRRNHIDFDLVPAIFKRGLFSSSYQIPDRNGGWMNTDPHDVKTKLVEVNKKYGNVVKPLIRLFKAWNANVGYPFLSYDVERFVANLNFNRMDYQCGFFHVIKSTVTTQKQTNFQNGRIDSLKSNSEKVREYLQNEDVIKAKTWLHKILPLAAV